jgi:hypothetical protein
LGRVRGCAQDGKLRGHAVPARWGPPPKRPGGRPPIGRRESATPPTLRVLVHDQLSGLKRLVERPDRKQALPATGPARYLRAELRERLGEAPTAGDHATVFRHQLANGMGDDRPRRSARRDDQQVGGCTSASPYPLLRHVASSGAGVFTPDLSNGVSCHGPAVRLHRVPGISRRGILRGLRHAPRPSAGIGPCRTATSGPARARRSRVHHDPFDRVGSRLYPYGASGGHAQHLAGHHARITSRAWSGHRQPWRHRCRALPMSARFRVVSEIEGLPPPDRLRSAFRSC